MGGGFVCLRITGLVNGTQYTLFDWENEDMSNNAIFKFVVFRITDQSGRYRRNHHQLRRMALVSKAAHVTTYHQCRGWKIACLECDEADCTYKVLFRFPISLIQSRNKMSKSVPKQCSGRD